MKKAQVIASVGKALREQTMLYPGDTQRVIDRIVEDLFPKETLDDWPTGWGEGKRGSLGGMWADVWYPRYNQFRLRIMSSPNWDPREGTALVYWPGNEKNSAEEEVPAGHVKPRFDLPRAWNNAGGPALPQDIGVLDQEETK